jgi:small subunit ribosomal protein S9
MAQTHSIGRRKTSVARVYIKPGKGVMKINNREAVEFLNHEVLRMKVRRPFEVVGLGLDTYDVKVNVTGGGVNGQAEAIRLGIARALEKMNPEYRTVLKKEGLLTVDSRQVERKKYGLRKARRSTQFSKR